MAAKNDKKSTDTGVLLPYQRRWNNDRSAVKVIEKSRRVGISWAEAAEAVLFSASDSGDDTWYIGYNKEMALEFIDDAGKWAKDFNKVASAAEEILLKDEDRDILCYRIKFANGHRITALSSRPTGLRGKQGRVIIDEAAFHEDLPGLIKAAMAFLMWGGDVRIISTHFGEANDFNSLIQDIRAGRKPYTVYKVTFDDALKDGLYRRICEVMGKEWTAKGEKAWRKNIVESYGDDADEELFCIPSQGTGVFLPRALIETCLSADLPVIRWAQKPEFTIEPEPIRERLTEEFIRDQLIPLLETLDPRRRCYFGEDFGRTGDLTVILPLQERQDASFYAPFVLELRGIPFEQQRQILFAIVDRLPRFTYGALDAGGNGHYLAEVAMQRYGVHRIEQIKFHESWYQEHMPKLKAAFEDRSILLPKDADLIEDFRALKMVKGVARLPEVRTKGKADKQKRHGDAAIAGALAWYATRAETASLPEILSGAPRTAPRLVQGFDFRPWGRGY